MIKLSDSCDFEPATAVEAFLQQEIKRLIDVIAAYENSPPVAWINRDGTYVELSNKSTVYGSHAIPLIMQHEVVYTKYK